GREAIREENALERTPEYLPGHQENFCAVDRHDKAQALAAARLRNVLADDADDLARHVEYGAPGVTRVDRGRGLKELRQGHVRENGVGWPARADPAHAHRIREPIGGADDHDLLADRHRVRGA